QMEPLLIDRIIIVLFFKGAFTVNGPKQSVIAEVGEDVTLPCWITPGKPENMEVRWFKSVWENLVYQYQEMDPHGDELGSAYQGRARLFPERISAGNVSLHLSSVRTSDEGKYKCFVKSSREVNAI
uniref:Ig-like domain-containing protein n=1 Tax=Callorhinchus milii TaxID=7868 RepID=A0A4W3GPL9_CALMI